MPDAPEPAPTNVIEPKLASSAEKPGVGTNKPEAERPNPFEERISALIGATNEAREAVSANKTENQEIKSAIAELSARISNLPQGAPAANPPSANPFDSPAGQVANPGAQNLEELIAAAVDNALKPIQEANSAQAALLDRQRSVFAEVRAADPALNDPTSEDFAVFGRLYDSPLGQKLRSLPEAPRIVAEMTRGILSEKRLQERDLEVSKARATIVPTSRSRSPVPEGPEKIREALTELVGKGRSGGFTDDDLGNYLQLKTAEASSKA